MAAAAFAGRAKKSIAPANAVRSVLSVFGVPTPDWPDLVIAVTDLEVFNDGRAAEVVAYFSKAVGNHVAQHRFSEKPGHTKQAVRSRLKERASFHVLVPMVEAYFFGDPAALARAGAKAT